MGSLEGYIALRVAALQVFDMDAQHKDEANYINSSVVEPPPPPYTKVPIVNTDIEQDFTEPVKKFCHSCQQEVVTRVESTLTSIAWAWCLCCFFCGAGLIPGLVGLCIPAFKEFRHFCPKCRQLLVVYNPEMTGGQLAILIFVSVFSLGIGALIALWQLGIFNDN